MRRDGRWALWCVVAIAVPGWPPGLLRVLSDVESAAVSD